MLLLIKHHSNFKTMEKSIGKEYQNPIERESYLKDNCDKVEDRGYMKKFTHEKIQTMKEELAETSIEINDIECEKKIIVKQFKDQVAPLHENRNILLKGIKEKAEYVHELCYKFIDQEERVVSYYNSEGDLVDSRTANADELQLTIFSVSSKTGTNN